MQIVNTEEAKQIINVYVSKFSDNSNIKPLMFYAGDNKMLDNVRHFVLNDKYDGRVHTISDKKTDEFYDKINGDYSQKEVYICFTYSNEQFKEEHIEYACSIADRDKKPLIYFGDKTYFPKDKGFDERFDVYEIA